MKKYIIIAAVFTVCLTLCAAVWPQTEMAVETPGPIQVAAISTSEPTVEDITAEAKTTPPTEEEKIEIPQTEPLHEIAPESEPAPEEVPVVAEVQSVPEPESKPVSVPESTPAPASSQTVADPQPGDMVYVPGFGQSVEFCRNIVFFTEP